jgi:hypothetical protein
MTKVRVDIVIAEIRQYKQYGIRAEKRLLLATKLAIGTAGQSTVTA